MPVLKVGDAEGGDTTVGGDDAEDAETDKGTEAETEDIDADAAPMGTMVAETTAPAMSDISRSP